MLVLSRKKDERIVLRDENDNPLAVITIVRIDANKVRVGIDANSDITVLREELIAQLQK
jgi:carbon storage regulator CsrA